MLATKIQETWKSKETLDYNVPAYVYGIILFFFKNKISSTVGPLHLQFSVTCLIPNYHI